ncbi:secondary thiamine-phosphate synthase enzyme YjbQ [Herbinix luporum]|jgi:secondary thiamine-phosphate synthase enzyme|uniref:secondary thiamine-phosphate synthase enzyme YjbQ n=1 Tax=Herbinix luporum TaxID=1679721 RepID=UPI000B3F8475|nr:secondary thiamine-phosphate synthase enzyme YjbQ [Herbinix luporum]HHT57378.1 YjbQ family protein [Herbinix luporum]
MNRKWIYSQRKDRFIVGKVYTFSIRTPQSTAMVDISSKVQEAVSKSQVKNGLCLVFIPHTTAAVTINENADPDVVRDFLMEINKVIPFNDGYLHMEGNSAAHIKASLMGFSETIIIEDSRLLLGTWQGIYLTEFDGPRVRKVHVKIIEG